MTLTLEQKRALPALAQAFKQAASCFTEDQLETLIDEQAQSAMVYTLDEFADVFQQLADKYPE